MSLDSYSGRYLKRNLRGDGGATCGYGRSPQGLGSSRGDASKCKDRKRLVCSACPVISVPSIHQQVKDMRALDRPATLAVVSSRRCPSDGRCDGALGDGAQPVVLWVRLDQLAAGDDEPLAGADHRRRVSRRSPRTDASTLMVYPAVSTSGLATAPAAKVRPLSAA